MGEGDPSRRAELWRLLRLCPGTPARLSIAVRRRRLRQDRCHECTLMAATVSGAGRTVITADATRGDDSEQTAVPSTTEARPAIPTTSAGTISPAGVAALVAAQALAKKATAPATL